ncbi:unnamed protein product [Ascophyllum nodosum]
MRSDVSTVVVILGLAICGGTSAAPTFSCFDFPTVEGQTSPLGTSMDHLPEAECCEALIDESDILAGRLVVFDPINCISGPDETDITEAVLCYAHDTDGCRFCYLSCDGFEDPCILCIDVFSGATSPTPIPVAVLTEAPLDTLAPLDSPTPAPVVVVECGCLQNITDTEAEVLTIRGKTMRCDPTCSNDEDLVWGVINCNYFGLGQDCRTCADTCEEQPDGIWLDQYLALCKPCSAIP